MLHVSPCHLFRRKVVEGLISLHFGSWFMGGNRGENDNLYALYEELEGGLCVHPYAEPLYVYKK